MLLPPVQVQAKKEEVRRKLRERRVPSSPIGRVAGFAQLGASLVYGTVADQVGLQTYNFASQSKRHLARRHQAAKMYQLILHET